MPLLLCMLFCLANPLHACSATLYGDDMKGWSATFYDGDYDYAAFTAAGARDNEASSIRVDGYECIAVLFGDAGFGGWHATFKEGIYHFDAFLKSGAHNDAASAIRVGKGIGNSRPQCKDTPGWLDQYSHGCMAYEKDGHCAGGNVLHDWIKSSTFHDPHLHCCICGGGSTAGWKESGSTCQDTSGWLDPHGHGCDKYLSDGHCAGGYVLHEYIAKDRLNNPHQNCCVCGKQW